MRALATGEERALEELYRRYERPLHQFLYRHTGGRDVEDLHQETWLRVVRSARRFDPARRFSTWLFQIAINLCRDLHRRAPDEIEVHDPSAGSGTSSEPVDVRAELRIDAQALLRSLPEPQREVVILRYYHDFSEEEAARILGCPRGTVKSRLHHAIRRLIDLTGREP
ncbi:MAG: RNA polymerase sigma factor [Candidatus Binatia bacterium]